MHNKVAVVGLGYVGLPVALLAKKKGCDVYGYDVVQEKVDAINAGKSPIEDDVLERDLHAHRISASTDPSVVAQADVVIVAVPTPVTKDKQPDLGPLKSALRDILPYLHAGQLLSIESTVNPGVINEIIIPLLKERSGLALDVDCMDEHVLYIVHCPERINPGDQKWTIEKIPRVVGGYTQAGVDRAKRFYEGILDADVKVMGSVTEAEAVKILENTFRDVNIAFINEMAKSFDKLGIDITNVIAGAATKPFAFMPHYPGCGVGGHCISVDPYYMINRAHEVGFNHEFLKLARSINDSMPEYTVKILEQELKKRGIQPRPVVVLLGLAYKRNIDDIRESPALTIKSILERRPVELRVFDPYVPDQSTVHSLDEATSGADAIILATDHNEFIETLTPDYLSSKGVQLVIDGRNALDGEGISREGVSYRGIGRQGRIKK